MGSTPSVNQKVESGSKKLPTNHDKTVRTAHEPVEPPEDDEVTPGSLHEDNQSADDQHSTPDMTEHRGGTPKKHVQFQDSINAVHDAESNRDKAKSIKSKDNVDGHSGGENVKTKFVEPLKTSTFTIQNPENEQGSNSSSIVDNSSKRGRSIKTQPGEDQMRVFQQGESSFNHNRPPDQTASTSHENTTRTKGTKHNSSATEEMPLNASFNSKPSSASSTETKKPPKSKTVKQKDNAFPNSMKHKRPPASMNSLNLEFYQNKIPSKPHPGHKIDEMLKWKGNYRKLEVNHRYIQWFVIVSYSVSAETIIPVAYNLEPNQTPCISASGQPPNCLPLRYKVNRLFLCDVTYLPEMRLFPIPEPSDFNLAAQPLQDHEIEAISQSAACQGRFLQAYVMMLHFYGIQIEDKRTGDVSRCPNNWKKRFAHLNKSGHNYLRITRIIKSLDCFGFRHYQRPLVLFFLHEIFMTSELSAIRHGAVIRWIDSLGDDRERYDCLQFFQELQSNSSGNFNPHYAGPEGVSESDSDSEGEFDKSVFEPAHTQYTAEKGLKLESDVPVNDTGQELHNSADISKEEETTETSEHLDSVLKERKPYNSRTDYKPQPTDHSTPIKNDQARQKRREKKSNAEETDGPIQNLKFYRNKQKTKPEGWEILDILNWRKKCEYNKLEKNPYVFQWLFPIFETTGRNTHAQPLEIQESEIMKADTVLSDRFCLAYEMMLSFYGLKLLSKNGAVTWGENWEDGFERLASSVEDHRRITRILQSLACLGRWYFQYPLVSFLLNEIFFWKRLNIPRDTVKFWIDVMADKNDRLACDQIILELDTFKTVESEWDEHDDSPGKDDGTVSTNTLEQHTCMSGQRPQPQAKQNLQF